MFGDLLILNGALRGDGNTAALLNMLVGGNQQDCVTAEPGHKIAACRNCGYCKRADICAVSDGMEAVYRAAETAGRVVIASPVYFGSLTGFLSDVFSRFQRYFKDGYGNLPRVGSKKEGAVILTAGGYGRTESAERSAALLMKLLNVETPVFITSYKTDTVPACKDTAAVAQIAALRERWFGRIVKGGGI